NKFAYLGQYLDKAYNLVTSNETGLLSEYGDFFPTEPGPTALVTMTNWGENVPGGTGIVNVIKLQLDVNHDGVMDLTFGGPDNTSPYRPFVFWINDDWDIGDTQPGRDIQGQVKDGQDSFIDSQRDLEDFARLWICGIPALTNGNFQITLSWET